MITFLFTVLSFVLFMALTTDSVRAEEFTATPSISLSETYSDNVDLNPDGDKDSAFLTDVTPGLRLRLDKARATGALDAEVTVSHQTDGELQGLSLLPALTGVAEVELLEQLLFFDASAAISREVLDVRDRPAESNKDLVQTYRASPYLTNEIGSIAESELRYTFTQVFVDQDSDDDAADETGHALNLLIKNREDSARFLWSLQGSASVADRSDDNNVERRQAIAGLEIPIVRQFSVLGNAGYEYFDDGDPDNEVDGPAWRAGVRLRPVRDANILLTYGRRDGEESIAASLGYRIERQFLLNASYEEALLSSQEQLTANISSLALDPESDRVIDSQTGLEVDPNNLATGLDARTRRLKRFTASAFFERFSHSFQANGVYAIQETEGREPGEDDENVIGVGAGWNYQLNQAFSTELTGSFRRIDFEERERLDREYVGTLGLNYDIYKNLSGRAAYSFRHNESTDRVEEYTENRFTVGLRLTF